MMVKFKKNGKMRKRVSTGYCSTQSSSEYTNHGLEVRVAGGGCGGGGGVSGSGGARHPERKTKD